MKVLIGCSSCWRDIRNGSNQAIRSTWGANLPEGWDLRFFVGGKVLTQKEMDTLCTPEWMASPGTLGNMNISTSKAYPIGSKEELLPDEIMLDEVGDTYLTLPWKTSESLRWAMERSYDYVFRIFVDTYCFPDRLEASGFQANDASGWTFGCGPCFPHPNSSHSCPLGGAGYWTSRKAIDAILDPSNCSLEGDYTPEDLDRMTDDELDKLGVPISHRDAYSISHRDAYSIPNPMPIGCKPNYVKRTTYASHWGEDTMVGYALHKANIALINELRLCYDFNKSALANRSKLSIHLNDRFTKWDPKLMIKTHKEQELARLEYPNWKGYCSKCGSYDTIKYRFGIRCKNCGLPSGQ